MFHRTGLTFGILFLFIGMSIIPSMGINIVEKSTVSTLDGNTLYVGGSGEGNYTKIQDAIDNASDGDTVFVYDDSSPYNEFVWINKSIDLIGEDRNTTVIDGWGTGYRVVVYITADNVSVTGFTILDCGVFMEKGIIIYKAANVIVSGNIIKNNNLEGVDNFLSSNTTIFGNTFIDNPVGIGLGGSGATVRGNTITNHTFGIALQSSSNVIEENTIFLSKKPELFNNTWGIALKLSSNNTIKGNRIINHLWGIQIIQDSNNNIISGNTLINSFVGIYLHESSYNEINGNSITTNYHIGLWLKNPSDNNNIVRNTITNSSEYGIYLEYSFSNKIKENNFIENNRSAYFENSLFNRWIRNYWERQRLLPYPIFGKMKLRNITFPWMNFDWRPALKPHDLLGGI